MIEASKMLVQASTTGGPASTCGPTGRMSRTHPPPLGYSSYCSTCTQGRLQQREASARQRTREHLPPAFAAFDTRIHHKLIAAATLRASDAQQQIARHLQECVLHTAERRATADARRTDPQHSWRCYAH